MITIQYNNSWNEKLRKIHKVKKLRGIHKEN